MPWTTPGTATAGEVLTASFWNTQVRDNFNDHEARFKQYGYVEQTSYPAGTAINQTTFASATEFFPSDITWTADGTSKYMIEVFVPLVFATAATLQGQIRLSDGGTTDLGFIWFGVLTAGVGVSAYGKYFYTPAAGSRSINARLTVNANAMNAYASDGGASDYLPAFLRVAGAG